MQSMTWVKICGITNLEDALAAVDAGADALGFVFYEKSSRRIDAETARLIVEQLPEKVEKIGVFVDLAQEQLAEIVNEVGLTGVQCRLRPQAAGAAPEGRTKYKSPVRMLMPLSVTRLLEDEKRLQGLTAEFVRMSESRKPSSAFDTFLLDSSTTDKPGGTGKVFDWQRIASLVQVMNKSVKVIAAGGLTPENVGKAMRILHPWGVDVSSGVEAGPGKKDPEKVRAFIRAVREADKN
jgi:phosphoribosylanthranilate isomerase